MNDVVKRMDSVATVLVTISRLRDY